MWELSQIYPRRVKLHWVGPGHTLNSGCFLGDYNLHFQFTAMTRFQIGQFVTSCASAQRQNRRTASNTPLTAAYLKCRSGLAMQDYIPIHVGLSLFANNIICGVRVKQYIRTCYGSHHHKHVHLHWAYTQCHRSRCILALCWHNADDTHWFPQYIH